MEDVQHTVFRVNASYARDLRDALHPGRRREESRDDVDASEFARVIKKRFLFGRGWQRLRAGCSPPLVFRPSIKAGFAGSR